MTPDPLLDSVRQVVFDVLAAARTTTPDHTAPTPDTDAAATVTGSEGLAGRKYHVVRLDGRDAPGEKHHDCPLFVLDLRHDQAAVVALAAYAAAITRSNPTLADDLVRLIEGTTP